MVIAPLIVAIDVALVPMMFGTTPCHEQHGICPSAEFLKAFSKMILTLLPGLVTDFCRCFVAAVRA